MVESQHAIQYGAGLRNQNRQHAPRGKPRKMNVLQHLARGRAGQGHAQPAGDERQHVRSPLQVLMAAGDAAIALLNLSAAGFAQR